MSAEEAYREKQRFIAESERRLRRQLSETERNLLGMLFERVIDRMDTKGGVLQGSADNHDRLNALGRIHKDFTTPRTTRTVARFASDIMQLPVHGGRYFGIISPDMAERINSSQRIATDLLRARLGLTEGGGLNAGGYLQSVIEDTTIRNRLRAIIARAIDEGGHVTSVRTQVREYLIGKEGGAGAMTIQADRQLVDTMMDADRASDSLFATDLQLQGAVYTGGLIETTRTICCQLDAKAWTREEMQALNDRAANGRPWSGYKGDIETHCGGWNCRHGWRWLGTAALLRLRPDLERIPGTKLVRYKVGTTPQPLNTGCSDRRKAA